MTVYLSSFFETHTYWKVFMYAQKPIFIFCCLAVALPSLACHDGRYQRKQSKPYVYSGQDQSYRQKQGLWEVTKAKRMSQQNSVQMSTSHVSGCLSKPLMLPMADLPATQYNQARFSRNSFTSRDGIMPIILGTMALLANVAYAAEPIQPNSSVVCSKPYEVGQEAAKFGLCETLIDDSKLCCAIQANYTIACCLHPNTRGLSHCVSFDPGGIIGDESESIPINITAALREARKECSACVVPPQAHRIADETKAFARKYKILSEPGEKYKIFVVKLGIDNCTLVPSEGNFTPDTMTQLGISPEPPCTAPGTFIWDAQDFPTLFAVVDGLWKKFNLGQASIIEIINDEMCGPLSQCSLVAAAQGYQGSNRLTLTTSFLQSHSDKLIAATIAHEIHHVKQFEPIGQQSLEWYYTNRKWCYLPTDNNHEAEADIASILATHSPCIASLLSELFVSDDYKLRIPMIDRENAAAILKAQSSNDIHPTRGARLSLILTIYEHYRRTRKLLLPKEQK